MIDELAKKRAELAELAMKQQGDECADLAGVILASLPPTEVQVLIVSLMMATFAACDVIEMDRDAVVKVFGMLARTVQTKAELTFHE